MLSKLIIGFIAFFSILISIIVMKNDYADLIDKRGKAEEWLKTIGDHLEVIIYVAIGIAVDLFIAYAICKTIVSII